MESKLKKGSEMAEIFQSLAALTIVMYGFLFMIGGPKLANRIMGRVFRAIGKSLGKTLKRLIRFIGKMLKRLIRFLGRGLWAVVQGISRGLWWVIRRIGRLIRRAWLHYPRASGIFWGLLAGVSVTILGMRILGII